MKTKHIFLPFYALLLVLTILQLVYKFDFDKLTIADLLAVSFLQLNMVLGALYILERVVTNWDKKVFKNFKSRSYV